MALKLWITSFPVGCAKTKRSLPPAPVNVSSFGNAKIGEFGA
jgi:hypothetical protein